MTLPVHPTFAAGSVPNPMRAKTNFTSKFMLICPVQSPLQKYFGFSEPQITAI
jgi:hypothetical protein